VRNIVYLREPFTDSGVSWPGPFHGGLLSRTTYDPKVTTLYNNCTKASINGII
jgi:hypothetical protein